MCTLFHISLPGIISSSTSSSKTFAKILALQPLSFTIINAQAISRFCSCWLLWPKHNFAGPGKYRSILLHDINVLYIINLYLLPGNTGVIKSFCKRKDRSKCFASDGGCFIVKFEADLFITCSCNDKSCHFIKFKATSCKL